MNTLQRITPTQARVLRELIESKADEFLVQRLTLRAAFMVTESESIREDREGRALMRAVKMLDSEMMSVMNELADHDE